MLVIHDVVNRRVLLVKIRQKGTPPLSFDNICNGETFIFRDSITAQSAGGTLITNAHYKSTTLIIGHERERCTT